MGAAASGGRGFKEATRVSGEMPIGAAGCRQQHNQASCQPPPPAEARRPRAAGLAARKDRPPGPAFGWGAAIRHTAVGRSLHNGAGHGGSLLRNTRKVGPLGTGGCVARVERWQGDVLEERKRRGGGGLGHKKFVYQKWTEQICPSVNFVFLPRWSLWSERGWGGVHAERRGSKAGVLVQTPHPGHC